METVEGYCEDCPNRKHCRKPCKPVEKWLRDGRAIVFEDKRGDITVVYGQHNEVRFSELPVGMDQDHSSTFADQTTLTHETIPVQPRQLRAKIFYERFFNQKTNKQLAKELGISPNYCSTRFREARQRLLRLMEALDGRDYGLKNVERSTREFTDNEKWFLLVKVFGFSIAEVSRMPGAPSYDALKQRIWKMYHEYRDKLDGIAA